MVWIVSVSSLKSKLPWIHRSFCNLVYFRHTLVFQYHQVSSVRFLSMSSIAHLEWFRIAVTILKHWEFCISFLRSVEVWYKRTWVMERVGNAKFANILPALDWTAGVFLVSVRISAAFRCFLGFPQMGWCLCAKECCRECFRFPKLGGASFVRGFVCDCHWNFNLRNETEMCQSKGSAVQTYVIWRSKHSPHTWRCSLERLPKPLSHSNGLNQFFSRTCCSGSINSGQEHLGPAAQWEGYWGRSCHAFVRLCMQSFRVCCHILSVVLSRPFYYLIQYLRSCIMFEYFGSFCVYRTRSHIRQIKLNMDIY